MERVQPAVDKGGTWIDLGDKSYKVPPLSLRQVKELPDKMAVMQSMQGGLPTQEQIDVVVDVVHGALKRNYPDLPRDEVYDAVDLGNFMDVMFAVLRGSGLRAQEGGASGESKASTGTTSTSP